jgi:predicted nucleotidyltransferase
MVRLSKDLKQINIDKYLPKLVQYCEADTDILSCILYGSYGTPYQTPLSDVDLAILLMPKVKWDYNKILNVIVDISKILKEDDANLAILNEVPLELQYEILATGRTLYLRDPILFADFKEYVIKFFLDFKIDLDRFYEDYEIALLED